MIQKIVMLDMITIVVIEDIEINGIHYSYHDDHDCDLELLLKYSIAIDSVDIQ